MVNNGAIFDRLEQSFAKAERSINIVRLWDQPSVLHSKTMLVDEHLSVVGSVVDELVKAWEADVAWCVEVP